MRQELIQHPSGGVPRSQGLAPKSFGPSTTVTKVEATKRGLSVTREIAAMTTMVSAFRSPRIQPGNCQNAGIKPRPVDEPPTLRVAMVWEERWGLCADSQEAHPLGAPPRTSAFDVAPLTVAVSHFDPRIGSLGRRPVTSGIWTTACGYGTHWTLAVIRVGDYRAWWTTPLLPGHPLSATKELQRGSVRLEQKTSGGAVLGQRLNQQRSGKRIVGPATTTWRLP
ncbi:hypothetical protein B0H67DRAFT_159978 [Lasiosphaeris hirsuta]|uniref:Uncharacterized protein n=1 Tax=Lasiosphaeris hirsuta TaxID=260670 RepID=A0AA40E1Z3_9PEZI|nr:hypothetical protein B0H67DRAFT_159978 [Lasiosphaeris hirsuta]